MLNRCLKNIAQTAVPGQIKRFFAVSQSQSAAPGSSSHLADHVETDVVGGEVLAGPAI